MIPIVGVGASAGGVEALQGFFGGMPQEPGMAFVIVTHLNPQRKSLLHEVVARLTPMPVLVAAHGVRVERDHVYVLPSDAILTIAGGTLDVRKPDPLHRERKPIDLFLSSLAEDRGEYAAAAILSGGDGDGTLGAKAVKQRGGLTLAQVADGHGPAHPDMPQTAIATGFIDLAVPAAEMGPQLVEFARSLNQLDRLTESANTEDERLSAVEEVRLEICATLRNQLGHDFAGYKPKTFLRRVQRRMQINQLATIEAYLDRLRADPTEVGVLFRDLLINVTSFFRDADAFETLARTVIPKLFEGRGADEAIRIWVPGCATGEEVYSVAILMREHMETLSAVPKVQLFATDIDEHALAIARTGRYPEGLLDGVSPDRRQRFFSTDGASFVIGKEVRDLCIFSPHSVLRDPPFSTLDLVSCRNLLIYFGPEAQRQVIPVFHYALRPGGYLFLGTSENVSQFSDLFGAVDKKHRIFRSRDDGGEMARRLPLSVAGLTPGKAHDSRIRRAVPAAAGLRHAVEARVLEQFAPPHVVINRDGDVVHYSARTGKYLEPAVGIPNRHLVAMARRGLRLDLRTALREAVETGRTIVREGLAVESDDERVQIITLTIEPMARNESEEPLFLVLFADQGATLSREEALARLQVPADGAALQLERELRDTRERLQSLVEEYETALEELKSSNEELVSVNEESQSTNEELEASKEELQSLNEELHTVNSELNSKVDALDLANSDLQNLFESSQLATVFLDKNLVIRSFTPAVADIFNILPGDRGRPLTDLTSRISLPTLTEDVRTTLEAGNSMERRVEAVENDRTYLVRLAPYRNSLNRIDGVVVTFVDVTSLARAEEHQRTLVSELNHRVRNMLAIVIAVAEQTVRGAASIEAFHETFVGRLQAMATSYSLLSEESWTETSIKTLAREQLAPFGKRRVKLDGPEIRLKPKCALSLGMVLHELATNAGKYGALSMPEGEVSVTWSQKKNDIKVVWKETGGPAPTAPAKPGFGLKLVERETQHALGGKSELRFAPEGLVVTLRFEL
ncbi:two-component system CheB/CheR fusion protein [Inquilinus ginsengisoli]|uniref:CheR family methyltransferase n=1 Tax=Inquilinus ginsengisoli TaxID=363840 RepID=UPI003D1E3DA3